MANFSLLPPRASSDPALLTAATWGSPRDPTVYATLEVRAERLLSWIDLKRRESDERVSVTHAVVRALALALRRQAQCNAVLRWGRPQLRRDVDIYTQVAVQRSDAEASTELAGVCIRQADTRSVNDLSREIREGTQRQGGSRDAGPRLPPLLLAPLLRVLRWLQVDMNLDTGLLGAERDPYGSAMVTSLGMMGVRVAYAPLHPMASCPVVLMVGAVEQRPVVEDGAVVAGRVLFLNLTCDHRLVDSVQAANLGRELKRLLEHPRLLEQDGERDHMLLGAQLATSELDTLDLDSETMTQESATEDTGYDETPMRVL